MRFTEYNQSLPDGVQSSISVHDAVKTNVWPRCTAAHRAAACHNQRIAGSDDVLQSKTQHYLRQSSKVPAAAGVQSPSLVCSRARPCPPGERGAESPAGMSNCRGSE